MNNLFLYLQFIFFLENLHSKRINSGDSNKQPVTENNEYKENDHRSKKLNERRTSTPDKSTIIENIHTIPDTTHQPVEKDTDESRKKPTILGKMKR
jgi:hypothetical protein